MVRSDVADRRIQRAFALAVSRLEKRETNHPRDGEPRANHVRVYKLRHDVCTD